MVAPASQRSTSSASLNDGCSGLLVTYVSGGCSGSFSISTFEQYARRGTKGRSRRGSRGRVTRTVHAQANGSRRPRCRHEPKAVRFSAQAVINSPAVSKRLNYIGLIGDVERVEHRDLLSKGAAAPRGDADAFALGIRLPRRQACPPGPGTLPRSERPLLQVGPRRRGRTVPPDGPTDEPPRFVERAERAGGREQRPVPAGERTSATVGARTRRPPMPAARPAATQSAVRPTAARGATVPAPRRSGGVTRRPACRPRARARNQAQARTPSDGHPAAAVGGSHRVPGTQRWRPSSFVRRPLDTSLPAGEHAGRPRRRPILQGGWSPPTPLTRSSSCHAAQP